jgi:hypothetical protein
LQESDDDDLARRREHKRHRRRFFLKPVWRYSGRAQNFSNLNSSFCLSEPCIVANMTASTVTQYLAALPADRRAALSAVRKVINENLPDGYEEGMQFGMIGWYVPLSLYPAGYGENPKVLGFPDRVASCPRLVRKELTASRRKVRALRTVAIGCARIAEVGHGAAFPVD